MIVYVVRTILHHGTAVDGKNRMALWYSLLVVEGVPMTFSAGESKKSRLTHIRDDEV